MTQHNTPIMIIDKRGTSVPLDPTTLLQASSAIAPDYQPYHALACRIITDAIEEKDVEWLKSEDCTWWLDVANVDIPQEVLWNTL